MDDVTITVMYKVDDEWRTAEIDSKASVSAGTEMCVTIVNQCASEPLQLRNFVSTLQDKAHCMEYTGKLDPGTTLG